MRFQRSKRGVSPGMEFLLAAIGMGVIAVAIMFSIVSAPRVRAQAPQAAAAPLPSFEVASIKPSPTGGHGRFFSTPDPGRLTATNVTTKMVIEFAYNVKDFQLTGGPGWIDSQGYDIEAKVEDSLVAGLEKLPRDARQDQIRLMLRSLLADRFKLTLTHETKELPMFALVVAKGGPKLTPTAFVPPDPNGPKPSTPPQNGPHLMMGPGKISAVAQPMNRLADLLAMEPDLGGRMVLDQTGIKGNYDFTVEFTQKAPFPNAPLPAGNSTTGADSSSLSIFTAIQEQLGLKLESTKGPVETYVIEHIEQPSEN
jgi:uncharacterized protein (TIGR03435 family)